MAKKVRCIVCPRTTDQPRRKMCQSCYRSAATRVANGESTWEELEEAGLCGPKGRRGRKTKWTEKADAVLAKRKGN